MNMSKDRMIVPLYCDGCGAPLKENLKCNYCGSLHERVKRYNGPEIGSVIRPPIDTIHYFRSISTSETDWKIDGMDMKRDEQKED